MIGYHYSVSFTYSVHACFVLRTNTTYSCTSLRSLRGPGTGDSVDKTRSHCQNCLLCCSCELDGLDPISDHATKVETAFPDELPAVPHLDEAPDTRAATSSMDAPRTGPGGEAEADRGSTRRRFDGSPNGALVHV